MKTNTKLAVAFLAAASSIAASAADAPAPVSAVTFDGYAALNYTNTTKTVTSVDLTAAKLGATGKFGKISAYASLYYDSKTTQFLDAYATYDAGSGLSITAGKFLSYMGYEAFDVPNMSQISYAQVTANGVIPAYHTGVKVDYSAAAYSAGLAVVDSIGGPSIYKGDGDWTKTGLEAYYSYKGIKDTTIWFGVADEFATKTTTYDLWVSYALSKTDTIAAEFVKTESSDVYWLAAYTKGLTDKWSVTSRISGDSPKSAPSNTKYTVSPSYTINDHFLARAEVSYTPSYGSTKSSTTLAAQTVYKF